MRALLADIGGTNARFALLEGGRVGPPLILPVADFTTAEAAIAAAITALSPARAIDRAVLAIAGPVTAEPVRLTNAAWELRAAALAARFGLRSLRLVNDFEALAHALPHLAAEDLHAIGGGQAAPGAPMLVLGPGTGLGCAALVPSGAPGGAVVVATEAGHAGLAPTDAAQDALLAALRRRCGRAGAEEALSGRGLAMLHAILAEGHAVPERDAAAVLAAAGHCPIAAAAIGHFLDLLAGFAGDMALAWGARGGVFLGGGILPRLLGRMDAQRFRHRFEDKAPMRDWLAAVPLRIIIHPAPAFPGIAALAILEAVA